MPIYKMSVNFFLYTMIFQGRVNCTIDTLCWWYSCLFRWNYAIQSRCKLAICTGLKKKRAQDFVFIMNTFAVEKFLRLSTLFRKITMKFEMFYYAERLIRTADSVTWASTFAKMFSNKLETFEIYTALTYRPLFDQTFHDKINKVSYTSGKLWSVLSVAKL